MSMRTEFQCDGCDKTWPNQSLFFMVSLSKYKTVKESNNATTWSSDNHTNRNGIACSVECVAKVSRHLGLNILDELK